MPNKKTALPKVMYRAVRGPEWQKYRSYGFQRSKTFHRESDAWWFIRANDGTHQGEVFVTHTNWVPAPRPSWLED